MTEHRFISGDSLMALAGLDDRSVQTCITSPPYYGLRDYGMAGQIGLEASPDAYVERLVEVFREVRRVLRDDGTLWINLGDSYAGWHGNANHADPTSARNGWTRDTNENKRGDRRPQDIGLKGKDLIGIPWRAAFALRDDGWYLRQEIIWHKPNPAPDGRGTASRFQRAHETFFLLSKSYRYAFNPSRDTTSVWSQPVRRGRQKHSASYPEDLIRPCVLAGSKPGDTILDPFGGSGTTSLVAAQENRRSVMIDVNPEFVSAAKERLAKATHHDNDCTWSNEPGQVLSRFA